MLIFLCFCFLLSNYETYPTPSTQNILYIPPNVSCIRKGRREQRKEGMDGATTSSIFFLPFSFLGGWASAL
jgi:hypothetical protein